MNEPQCCMISLVFSICSQSMRSLAEYEKSSSTSSSLSAFSVSHASSSLTVFRRFICRLSSRRCAPLSRFVRCPTIIHRLPSANFRALSTTTPPTSPSSQQKSVEESPPSNASASDDELYPNPSKDRGTPRFSLGGYTEVEGRSSQDGADTNSSDGASRAPTDLSSANEPPQSSAEGSHRGNQRDGEEYDDEEPPEDYDGADSNSSDGAPQAPADPGRAPSDNSAQSSAEGSHRGSQREGEEYDDEEPPEDYGGFLANPLAIGMVAGALVIGFYLISSKDERAVTRKLNEVEVQVIESRKAEAELLEKLSEAVNEQTVILNKLADTTRRLKACRARLRKVEGEDADLDDDI